MTKTREDELRQLKGRLAEISDVSSANGLLMWDRQTYMPRGGVTGRAEQTATLSRIAHEMLVDAETGRLLDALDPPDLSSEDGALVRRARREYEKG